MAEINVVDAISAYNKTNNISDKKYKDSENDFTSMVENAIGSTFDKVQEAEQNTQKSVTGDVSTEDLAISVANAENALNTLVTIRDRIVTAFQDIIRMPI